LPPDKPENDLTVTELVSRYWQFAEGYYRKNGEPTGVLPGIRVALRFLRGHYGHTQAAKFGPLALKALQQRMVEAGHSRPYLNNNVNHIRRVFKWAVAEQLVPVAVHQALAAVPGLKKGRTEAPEPAPIGPVSDEVVDATLALLPPVVADMVRFHRLVGCRPSEVCLIRPCDVDAKGAVWCYVPGSHKTEHHDRERRIYIGPKAQDVLRPYLLRDHESYCFSPKESRRKQLEEMRLQRKTPVQPSQIDRSRPATVRAPGDHYTKDSYNRAIRRAVERANGSVPRP
jgi:integrase